MRLQNLADELSRVYCAAARNRESRTTAVTLFGIKYADEIGRSTNDIVRMSGIGNWGPMVRNGIRLSHHVLLRDEAG